MSSRKIKVLGFTGIRSDYDLLSGLYRKLKNDADLHFKLIVSGAHLSATYGKTVRHIKKDGIPMLVKVESLVDSDSISSRLKSAALLILGCLPSVEAYAPDVILISGDREEAMSAALVGAYLRIPTVHFFGGDHASDGNVDNPVRHAISKLSSLHFVVHERHRKRLLRMGESRRRVFLIGNPAIDKFREESWIPKSALLKIMGRAKWARYVVMIFHPILGQEKMAADHFNQVLSVLRDQRFKVFVSYPNSDPGSREIISVIEAYRKNPDFVFYKNLDRLYFVNLLRHASFLIGNSSAGLLEAGAVPLGAVNVGLRQKGRLAGQNVVFVNQGVKSIRMGIRQVMSRNFHDRLRHLKSPFGDGYSVERAYKLLKEIDFGQYLLKQEDPLR